MKFEKLIVLVAALILFGASGTLAYKSQTIEISDPPTSLPVEAFPTIRDWSDYLNGQHFPAIAAWEQARDEVYKRSERLERWAGALFLIGLTLTLTLCLISMPWAQIRAEGHEEFAKLKRMALSYPQTQSKDNESQLQGRQENNSYSIAEELIKWKSLMDEGTISASEYDEAKARLLKKHPH